jgi:hypothetical protein
MPGEEKSMLKTILVISLCALWLVVPACGDKEEAPTKPPADKPVVKTDQPPAPEPPAEPEKAGLEKTVADLEKLIEEKLAAYEEIKGSNQIEAAKIMTEIADLKNKLQKAYEDLGK